MGYLTAYPNSLDICRSAVSAADEYYTWLRHRNEDIIQQTEALANLLDEVFRSHALAEAAGLLAQAAANLYMLTRETDTQKAKKFFDQVQDCYKRCPGSKQVRSAYASVISQQYLDGIDRQRDVPSKVLARLKKWSNHYPEDIEFQEAYFKMLFVHISHILSRGKRGEAARIFRELTIQNGRKKPNKTAQIDSAADYAAVAASSASKLAGESQPGAKWGRMVCCKRLRDKQSHGPGPWLAWSNV